jgi:hypothetical protein
MRQKEKCRELISKEASEVGWPPMRNDRDRDNKRGG